ncbi:MAG: PmoA family protein [Planctomycetes bacterium]|nr:PmoA family protein [Planctomycetota bacterium]
MCASPFSRSVGVHLVLLTLGAMWTSAACAQYSVKPQDDRVDILHEETLLTSYRFRSGSKPVLWPIIGPDQQRMTRSYPLDPSVEGEAHDHPHHRGLWMTFGDIDGGDWWGEGPGRGVVLHRRVTEATADGKTAHVTAEHQWVKPRGEGEEPLPCLKETCRYTFSGDAEERVIDCEYLWSIDGPHDTVTFGDTKEGMFAIRVPETMRGDRPGGELLNSEGDRGGDVWGKSAKWVDYSGPTVKEGEAIYGIAILVHPESFRAAGLWHARTYGLFAHNAFGIKDFLPGRTKTESGQREAPHPGGYVLKAGDSLAFKYRVVLHRGRWGIESGNDHWNQFAKTAMALR